MKCVTGCKCCVAYTDIFLHYLSFSVHVGGKSDRADNDQPELDARLCLPPV